MTVRRPRDNSPFSDLYAVLGYLLLSLFVTYALGQGADQRQLSLGFGPIRLGASSP